MPAASDDVTIVEATIKSGNIEFVYDHDVTLEDISTAFDRIRGFRVPLEARVTYVTISAGYKNARFMVNWQIP